MFIADPINLTLKGSMIDCHSIWHRINSKFFKNKYITVSTLWCSKNPFCTEFCLIFSNIMRPVPFIVRFGIKSRYLAINCDIWQPGGKMNVQIKHWWVMAYVNNYVNVDTLRLFHWDMLMNVRLLKALKSFPYIASWFFSC